MKAALGRLALLVGGMIIALGLAELILRWRHPCHTEKMLFTPLVSMPPDLYVSDPETHIRPRANYQGVSRAPGCTIDVRFNGLGLRGPPAETVAAALPQWLMLGDSFTLGLHVPETQTFSAQVGRQLGVHAWNGGVETYSTLQALGRYQQLRSALPLTRVILVFYVGNDIMDNNLFAMQPRPAPGAAAPVLPQRPVQTWWVRRSALAALLAHQLRIRALIAREGPRRDRWVQELRLYTRGSTLTARLVHTRRALRRLKARVAEDERSLMVAIVPPRMEMLPEWAARSFRAARIPPEDVEVEKLRRVVWELLGELHIDRCDLTPALAAARAPFLEVDGHFTVEGHAAAAEAIVACLEEH